MIIKSTQQGNRLINENGAVIEVIGVEPSHSIESMNWYNPYVDVRVRVYDEEKDFSECFTINKYVVPEDYIPENWHDMTSDEIWKAVIQNISDNIGELNVLNAILPLKSTIELAMDECCMEVEPDEDLSDEYILNALLDESGWSILKSNLVYDFKILKYECAVGSNDQDDYITDFEVEQNR